MTDSRLSAVGDVTRRRRECEKCARRFTTYERVEEVLPLVVKKDGRREMFDRVKLLGGLRRACDKREIGVERLEQVVDAIERDLIDSGEKEVRAQVVGEKVMNHLRTVDDIAYVRFASVYRSFRDIEEFRAELEKIAHDRAQDRGQAQSGRKPSSIPPSSGAQPSSSPPPSSSASPPAVENAVSPSIPPPHSAEGSSLPSSTPLSGVASVSIPAAKRGSPHEPNAPSRPTPSENSAKDQPQ